MSEKTFLKQEKTDMPPHPRAYPLDPVSIRSLRIFVAVAEAQSYTVAARQLHLAVSTVSKSVAGLETELGFPLLYRNTRRVSVTEAGERFYRRCRAVIAEISQASESEAVSPAKIRGHLRIVVSPSFSTAVLSPMLSPFLRKHPNVTVDVIVSSAMPNLVRERVDVAIMLRDQPETKTRSLRLAPNARAFCASPDYLAANGTPRTPQELAKHTCLVSLLSGAHEGWRVRTRDDGETLQVSGTFTSNDGNVIKNACLDGLGIANLYRYHVYRELAGGNLIELFPGSQPGTNSIYAIFPHREIVESHTQAFVDHIRKAIGDPPYWLQVPGSG
ncbi:LysR family transcriptional regulator [Aurantimonas sp. C2-6-R+9]|uniref:LysR family transcriptional regulator n=1 Tax=unclassified Aurantimonas TaxID=2638230 RepID=UPI002E17ED50|nr:LysR family transcriptional regulator [Aurantimonas sp. C2-6-R+9]